MQEKNNNSWEFISESMREILDKNAQIARRFAEITKPQLELQLQFKELTLPQIELQQRLAELTRPMLNYQQMTENITRPLRKALEQQKHIIQPLVDLSAKISASLQNVISIPNISFPASLGAMLKLSTVQYVFWDSFDEDFAIRVNSTENLDEFLLENEQSNDFESIKKIFDYCWISRYIEPYKVLFAQAIQAFNYKLYNLSAIGFTAVIDGVLTEITEIPSHKAEKKCDLILEKIREDEDLENLEYRPIILYYTFSNMANQFYAFFDFDGEEPECLNRHWLIHGRTKKKLTSLDCIKIVRFLFCIILVSANE